MARSRRRACWARSTPRRQPARRSSACATARRIEELDAIVVGGGQAGLAAGFELQKLGLSFAILDRETETGATWRRRWDSLRLFSPARFSELEGLQIERPSGANRDWMPTKDDLADYLAAYAEHYGLPIRHGCEVTALRRSGASYVAESASGAFSARAAVIATGAHQLPNVPTVAGDLDPGITQLHSSEYRRPEDVRHGDVLVVGAGASGAQIALELAGVGREVTLAGPHVMNLPARVLGRDLYAWLYGTGVLRARCDRPPGTWICGKGAKGGDERVGISRRDLRRAGISRCRRITGAGDGAATTDDGRTLEAETVIWCTGYRPAFAEWLDPSFLTDSGDLRQTRGVVGREPGLFCVGQPFQTRPDSGLVGGASADAALVGAGVVEALA